MAEHQSKHILLVEDDPEVADTTRMVLGIDNHHVEIATSGEMALAMFVPDKFDVVIVDFRLPKMNGLAVARAIKERSAMQPIIMLTAHAESLSNERLDTSAIDLVMEKPFPVVKMREALAKVSSPA